MLLLIGDAVVAIKTSLSERPVLGPFLRSSTGVSQIRLHFLVKDHP